MHREITSQVGKRLRAAQRAGHCLIGATEAGRAALSRRARCGDLISPYPNLYDSPEHWEGLNANDRHLSVLRALAIVHPGWEFCGLSAAVVHGTIELLEPPERPWVLTSPNSPVRSSKFARRVCLSGAAVTNIGRLRVTDPERTAFDCARLLDFGRGLAVCDATLRQKGRTRENLLASFEGFGRTPGCRAALRCARHASHLSENGGESRARAAMIELGFAAPFLQIEIPDIVDGRRSYRLDYLWIPGWLDERGVLARLRKGSVRAGELAGCVCGELDGWAKTFDEGMAQGRSAQDRLLAERRRESRLTMLGLRVVRFSFAETCDRSYFSRLLSSYGVPRAEK